MLSRVAYPIKAKIVELRARASAPICNMSRVWLELTAGLLPINFRRVPESHFSQGIPVTQITRRGTRPVGGWIGAGVLPPRTGPTG
jgi:hypothetical protein